MWEIPQYKLPVFSTNKWQGEKQRGWKLLQVKRDVKDVNKTPCENPDSDKPNLKYC